MSTMPGGARHPAADRLSAWLAGDLGERDAAVVRAHVDGCGACGGIVAELRAQGAELRALERPEPPPTLWPTIAGALEAREGSPASLSWSSLWSSSWSWPAWLSGALAGAALAACVAWLVVGRGDSAGTGRALRAATDGGTPGPSPGLPGRALRPGTDPLLAEAEGELDRAADSYAEAARRLRAILDREQALWAPETRARVAERLARLDEAIVHSRAVANRDPGDGAGAEMLFSAYQRQIDFLAEAVHRGSPGPDEGWH
jgi:hypothetical protein